MLDVWPEKKNSNLKKQKQWLKNFLMGFTGIKGLSSHGFFVGDEFVYTQFHE